MALKSFSSATQTLEVGTIKKFEILARSIPGTISLAQGIPSFETAGHIKAAAKAAIDANLVGKYTPSYGIEPLRSAIVKKLKEENAIAAVNSEILVTHGASEALMAIFLALLNSEDEVIIVTPGYASHLTQVQIALDGKHAVHVPLDKTQRGWQLNTNILTKAITKYTKAIVICNPTNPTGYVYFYKELKEIAKIAKEHNLYIVTDEMYEHFVYDGKKPISIASFPEVSDRTISVFGVSKSYAMTGWRIGYIVAAQPLIDQIFKIHDTIITSPTVVSQYAALAAITGPQDVVEFYKEAFFKRRQIVIDELKKTNAVSLYIPQGAYYAFIKINQPIDDEKFAIALVEKARVAVVPGSAFGKGGENHIRISFGVEEDILREGLHRLIAYLNKTIDRP